MQQAFRALLFSRIVPCVKDIGLWGEKVQRAYTDLGVLDAADSDLEALMRDDEDIAERIEQEHAAEFAARKAEVDAAIQRPKASRRSGAGPARQAAPGPGRPAPAARPHLEPTSPADLVPDPARMPSRILASEAWACPTACPMNGTGRVLSWVLVMMIPSWW